MAYLTGDLILDAEYNQFADTDVNGMWGTGTGARGYGQTSTLATVAPGTSITALQWSNLLDKMDTIASHQGNTITGIANPAAGGSIAILSALQTDITDLQTQADLAAVNSWDAANTTGGVATQSAAWKVATTCTRRVTFAGGNEARYFFNAGGKINIDFGYVKTTTDAKALAWEALVAAAGQYEMNAAGAVQVTGTGATVSSVGYYTQSTTPTVRFTQTETSPTYNTNSIKVTVTAGAVDAVDGLGNNGLYIDFKVEYLDAASDTAWTLAADTNLDIMDGTVTTTFGIVPPDSLFLTGVTWGSPAWSTPTADTQT